MAAAGIGGHSGVSCDECGIFCSFCGFACFNACSRRAASGEAVPGLEAIGVSRNVVKNSTKVLIFLGIFFV